MDLIIQCVQQLSNKKRNENMSEKPMNRDFDEYMSKWRIFPHCPP